MASSRTPHAVDPHSSGRVFHGWNAFVAYESDARVVPSLLLRQLLGPEISLRFGKHALAWALELAIEVLAYWLGRGNLPLTGLNTP